MTAATSRTQDLKSQFLDPKARSRPILTYINGDVSWLVSFPYPTSENPVDAKAYYHVVVDPWFGQPSIVISSLILEMKLGREPGLPNRDALDAAIVEIELAAGSTLVPTDANPAVDAIFVTATAEHCHKESLLQFSTSTPVFAVAAAASIINSWSQFDTVVTMTSCDPSKTPWEKGHPGTPLPTWLTVFPPAATRLNNFGLVLITSSDHLHNEFILMAPHGMPAEEPSIMGLRENVKMLALVAPLKDSYSFGMKTVLGVEDGLAMAKSIGARYYVRNGDFVSLEYKGVIGWTVRDVPHDLQWGYDKLGDGLEDGKASGEPVLVEVDNGGSFLLLSEDICF